MNKKSWVLAAFIILLLLMFAITPCFSIFCIFGHHWKEANCITPETCSICKKTRGERLEHNYSGGNCTTKEICTRCGIEGNFKHNLKITLCGPVYCRDCKKMVDFKEHIYNSDGVCKHCGEKESTNSSSKIENWKSVSTSDNDYAYALTAAQELVKDRLKSPSSAKFPWDYTKYSVLRDGNKWMVGGSVEAQNGFGAMIKSNWIATFTMSGSTYKVSDYDVVIY